jgi:hypothetical protein
MDYHPERLIWIGYPPLESGGIPGYPRISCEGIFHVNIPTSGLSTGSKILPSILNLISSSSSSSPSIPQLLKHNTYRIFLLAILVLFFDTKLPAILNTRSEGVEVAGIAK